jgi:hypothetical protein
MVACAIVIPAVAIFGKSLPDSLWDQCCRRLAAGGAILSPNPTETRSPNPAAANPTPELTGLELPKSASWQELGQAGSDAGRAETEVSTAMPPGGTRPDSPPAPLEEVASRTTGTSLAETPAAAADDRFTTIQQRLRQLGASWYALETWGTEGRFHFTCRVSVEGNPSLSRLFQSSDAEAVQAMAKVLHDVEAWKSPQSPSP